MATDIQILRDLARRIVEISESPVNLERKRLWLKHNSLQGERPMVLAEDSGYPRELAPLIQLSCQEKWARDMEYGLRCRIYHFEQVADDTVIMPYVNINWAVKTTDYGVQEDIHRPQTEGTLGSIKWDPPVTNIDRDFHKLHPRTYSVDRSKIEKDRTYINEIFGGILQPRLRGSYWWTLGLTWAAIRIIGLEPLMMFMYDDPKGLHRLMAFLRDDHMAYAKWLEAEGLLTLNNENDYIGSGGHGYCNDLPAKDYTPGSPARLKDLWVLSESQETVGVSPEMFEEFIFPYQKSITDHFGLVYYGCCEPVHSRWHVIRKMPNLRSVSVSPWCDQAKIAASAGRKYVLCRKPAPSMISSQRFDEDEIRADIRQTLTLCRGCEIEFAMKDVHTLAGQPQRLGRWVQIAREVIAEFH